MNLAAIDIGSNAVRLLVSQAVPYENQVDFTKLSLVRIPLRLGVDVFQYGSIGEEKALVTFVCMANSDDVVEDVSIRLALAKGMTSSMGAPSSTSLSPHEDSITQVYFALQPFCCIF